MTTGIRLWQHQIDGVELLRKHRYYALFDDVGCGKTFPLAIRVGEILREARKVRPQARALIIAEQSLIYQWPGEFAKVAPGWDVRYITGQMTAKEKREFWASPPDVIVTNYEYVKSIEAQVQALVSGRNLVVSVLDEIHNIAGYRGPRSKEGTQAARIVRLLRDVPFRYGATASPVANPDSPRIWGILNYIDPRVLPPTISMFERQFFDNFSPTYKYKQLKLKPSMVDELSRRIRTVSRRVLLEDTGAEVPERIDHDVYVTMSPTLRKFYQNLKEQSVAIHDGRPITRADVLARNFALLQVASGWIIDAPDPLFAMAAYVAGEPIDEKQVLHIDSSHKDRALADVFSQVGDAKVIVWAHFTHEIEHLERLIAELRGVPPSRVDGNVVGRDRSRAIDNFLDPKGSNTFLGQPGACGAGLNLQVAQHMVRYSRSHFVIDHEQSLGRNRRATRDQHFKRINYFSIMTDETVDVRTEMRNRGKKEFAGQILLDHLSYEERNR